MVGVGPLSLTECSVRGARPCGRLENRSETQFSSLQAAAGYNDLSLFLAHHFLGTGGGKGLGPMPPRGPPAGRQTRFFCPSFLNPRGGMRLSTIHTPPAAEIAYFVEIDQSAPLRCFLVLSWYVDFLSSTLSFSLAVDSLFSLRRPVRSRLFPAPVDGAFSGTAFSATCATPSVPNYRSICPGPASSPSWNYGAGGLLPLPRLDAATPFWTSLSVSCKWGPPS